MRKLNIKLDMRTAIHPQNDGVTGRVNKRMQIVLRYYTVKPGFDYVSHLPMDKFDVNCYINEAS